MSSNAGVPQILKDLVLLVARAFYDPKHVVVFEELVRERTMKDEVMAQRLCVNKLSDLPKILARLKEDRLIQSVRVAEWRRGTTEEDVKNGARKIHNSHFYIEYGEVVNVIKYKVLFIKSKVESIVKNTDAENHGFICPSCRRTWSALEAQALLDPATFMFVCEDCSVPLDEHVKEEYGGNQLVSRLMEQINPILDLLKQADKLTIPKYIFKPTESGSQLVEDKKEPRFRDGAPSGARKDQSEDLDDSLPMSVVVSFVEDEEESKRQKERAAEITKKKNAMPEWYTKSTIITQSAEMVAAANQKQELLDADEDKDVKEFLASKSQGEEIDVDRYSQLLVEHEEYADSSKRGLDLDDGDEDLDDEMWPSSKRVKMEANSADADDEHLEGNMDESSVYEQESHYYNDEVDVILKVAGEDVPLSEITEEHQHRMTEEEFQKYYEAYQEYQAKYGGEAVE